MRALASKGSSAECTGQEPKERFQQAVEKRGLRTVEQQCQSCAVDISISSYPTANDGFSLD